MYVRIVDDDKQWQIEIAVDEVSREAMMLQTLRSSEPAFRDRFLAQLALVLPQILADSLDQGLHPPTEKQLSFAVAIARELGIPIPGEAFRYREAMGEFLTRHAHLFRQRRAAQTGGGEVSKDFQ